MTDIFCIHPNVKDVESFLDLTALKGHVKEDSLRWNPVNPTVLIATEWTFYRKDLFANFRELYRTATLKVAWMGEAVSADMNIFDYCIGFDRGRDADPRFVRILSPLDMYHRFIPTKENEIRDKDAAAAILSEKTAFCNFLYSNPDAHPMRDSLFHALSAYKKVDSLGKHLNNVGVPGTGYGGHAGECIALKSPYKFSIASENACYDGYTSEKIITSLIAHTVPVYWGNPSVASDVNPECFINASDYGSLDALVAQVREIDNDPDRWAEMVSKPWFTAEQIELHARRSADYYSKMSFLLSGDAPKMVPEGYHTELYRKQFFKNGYAFGQKVIYDCFFSGIISRLLH